MTQKSDTVKLIAKDSFHTSQTGTVPARAAFETHRAHADELVKRGLAEQSSAKGAKDANEARERLLQHSNPAAGLAAASAVDAESAQEVVGAKKAPEPENKKAAEPSNKAKK